MKIYAATQKGVQKAQNEDRVVLNQNILSMGIHECECTEGFVAVTDGVGGNNAGGGGGSFLQLPAPPTRLEVLLRVLV